MVKLLIILSICSAQAFGLIEVGLRFSDFAGQEEWKKAVIELRNTAKAAIGEIPTNLTSSPSVKEMYFFEDNNGEGKSHQSFLASDLREDGTLSFTVEAGKDAPVRGWQMVDKMLAFYGPSIKKIKAWWQYGTNLAIFLEKYRELTGKSFESSFKKGKPSPELENIYKEAARATWTAQQIARYNFTNIEKITVFYQKEIPDVLEETYDIEVIFTPPNQ